MILSSHNYTLLVSPVQPSADLKSPTDWTLTANEMNRQGQLELLDELQNCIVANSLLASNWKSGFFAGSFIGNPNTNFRPTLDALIRLRKASAIRWGFETGRGGWRCSDVPKGQNARAAARAALCVAFDPDLVNVRHVESFMVHRAVTHRQMRELKQASKDGQGWMVDLWKQDSNPWIMEKIIKQELRIGAVPIGPLD